MSKAESRKSETPGAQRESASVYDFLYQDVRRVGSYLAQFVPSGHLQSVRQTTSAEESEQSEAGASASANAVVARAQGQFSDRVGSMFRDAMERTYDPIWINALDLLTLLNDRDMLHRDLPRARIGQFVLATGVLGILDMGFLQSVWTVPVLRKIAEGSITQGLTSSIPSAPSDAGRRSPKHDQARQAKSQAAEMSRGLIDLVQKLPHSMQARIATEEGGLIYAGLSADGLTTSSTDLLLKNGTQVAGRWSILGILDALPDAQTEADQERDAIALGILEDPFTNILRGMATLVRHLGRPDKAIGVTPLLIFREVTS